MLLLLYLPENWCHSSGLQQVLMHLLPLLLRREHKYGVLKINDAWTTEQTN